MRKVIDTSNYDWEINDLLKTLLDVQKLPRFIIIDAVEEE